MTKENYFMGEAALVWLRRDLRIADNPALSAAMKHGGKVVAIYIHETDQTLRPIGTASRWWLHESLRALAGDLAALGVPLVVRTGISAEVLRGAIAEFDADALFWNRRYGPDERAVDTAIKSEIAALIPTCSSLFGNILAEPWDISTGQGKPYSVYTPFWKTLKTKDIPAPLPRPHSERKPIKPGEVDADYDAPHWTGKLAGHWRVGEAAARERLVAFFDEKLDDYKEGRDRPERDATSGLSPHLAFGEISPRQVWHAAMALAQREPERTEVVDKFLSELAWRDFNYHQLYHRQDIAAVSMQPKYEGLEWRRDDKALVAWQRGLTGFPIVDAGMRELWATGVMQNRVRMLVASLLAKNLLIDWRLGEQWFWDTLVDADPASNPGNWQWVAGSGLDASPYFRIFNPVTQGERFDGDGGYVRRWVPELAGLPDEWVQKPFAAPAGVLAAAGIRLGETYPEPIVDLKLSRQRALDALAGL